MTRVWMACVLGATVLVACSRANPFFQDSGTEGATDGTQGPGSSPTDSASSQGPGTSSDPTTLPTSEVEGSETASETQSIGTSDDATLSATDGTTLGPSESSGVAGTGCNPEEVVAMLSADAFVVATDACVECADANYGAADYFGLFADDMGAAFYVVRFRGLPYGKEVLSARLSTNIDAVLEMASKASFEVSEFWPGCTWPEGTATDPGMAADGITWSDCDPIAGDAMPGGGANTAIGSPLVDPVMVGESAGLQAFEIELTVDAVQSWLDGDGDSIVIHAGVPPFVLGKPAREAADDGGLELVIEVCA